MENGMMEYWKNGRLEVGRKGEGENKREGVIGNFGYCHWQLANGQQLKASLQDCMTAKQNYPITKSLNH
jgi:hypothetical protein